MGERAAKFARARYRWDAIARAMTELYASVTAAVARMILSPDSRK